jgi:hypothetical protein
MKERDVTGFYKSKDSFIFGLTVMENLIVPWFI